MSNGGNAQDVAQYLAGAGNGGGASAVSVTAEARVLSAVFADPKVLDELLERLAPSDFGVPVHESLWRAILACDSAGRAIDLVTVVEEMTRAGELGQVGGVDAVTAVLEAPPAVLELSDMVDVISDRSLRRQILAAAREMSAAALNPTVDGPAAVGVAEKSVMDLSAGRTAETGVMSMPQVMAAVSDRMAKAAAGVKTGHTTGFAQLDDLCGGLEPGMLVVVAGRPGSGKSVFAATVGQHIAEVTGLVVPYLSYEMTGTDLGLRLLAADSEVPLKMLRAGVIPPGSEHRVARSQEKLNQIPLRIDEMPPPTFSALRSHLRRMHKQSPLGAIVVDYLQLMNAEPGVKEDNRAYVVGAISRGLKLLAGELGVPVIACSQLNRNSESRPGGRPLLSDLRESGSLEQDASLVVLVHRAHLTDPDAPTDGAELIVAKNRNGEAPATIEVTFQGRFTKFVDQAPDGDGHRGGGGLGGGGLGADRGDNNNGFGGGWVPRRQDPHWDPDQGAGPPAGAFNPRGY